jgi:hypothetical protein
LHRDPEEIIDIVQSENAAIRAELAELRELLKNQARPDDEIG